jgi:MFS family permease
MYRYQFTSTLEDLLEAEKVDRYSTSISVRFHWVVTLFGLALVSAGIVNLYMAKYGWRPILWLAVGFGILYSFAIRPRLRRSRIRKTNSPRQDVTLEFSDDCLRLEVSGSGEFVRGWDELIRIDAAGKGVLFYFSDGIVNWLPDRIFADTVERSNFIKFIQSHQNQEGVHSP